MTADVTMTADTARSSGYFPVADGRTTVKFVRGLLGGKWPALLGVAVILLLGAGLGLVIPWGYGLMVDTAIDGGGVLEILRIGGWQIAAAIASAALTGLGIALSAQLLETALAGLRERMVGAALRLPQARVEEAGSGDLVSRATDDVNVVSEAISRGVPALATSGFAIGATIAGFGALDWRFLIVVLAVLPVHWIGARRYLRSAPPVYRQERAAMAVRAHHMLGAIRGLPTVHSFNLIDQSRDRVGNGSWSVVRWSMRARIVQNRLGGKANLAEFVGMATVLLIGFYLVDSDAITVGAVTTAMLLFLRLFGPIGALLMVMDEIQTGAASLGRIVGVVDLVENDLGRPSAARDESPVETPEAVEICIDSLGFRYDGADHQAVDDVTVTIAAGETVAVVGASGAGKTTLATLIAGVHVPDSGSVRIGGTDLAELPEEATPVLLTQEVHVFSGTVAEDLRIAASEADEESLQRALETVGAWEWVSLLEDGLDSAIGAGGHELTPKHVQQLALARLVLRDPSVVILDEATADADSSDADALEDAAQAALRGRTAVVVAHRLSQAARADRILVMDEGRIVEEGTHQHLSAAGGRYAELWSAWSRFRAAAQS
ncbi:ABC transporter ATP-binding protein [Rhodococcus artemisiae]|uniref:ABC transporter ATP-binding protein n=1 Tax=Rhodococcus artemisiae TaxID=714159 RepID=A0ABU7LBX6_9NOCA|nr:ABC transporter ATP-binding protein [Rhodococcus artemisiae]MEE2059055.1 ABC transporter ATP-binding protein [Rhodococcus artemisiae]